MNKEKLKEYLTKYMCYYDLNPVTEFCGDILYSDSGKEYKYRDIDFSYFYVYKKEEYQFTSDLKDFMKLVNKSKKELMKFEKGNSFYGFLYGAWNLLIEEDLLDKLYDFYELKDTFDDLSYCKFTKVII